MATLQPDGPMYRQPTRESFTEDAELKTKGDELGMVNECAIKSMNWVANKEWALLHRDADILYQAPRPMSVYENTYILEPNVTRFTVAKVCQSIVPQFYKGLFYEDPAFTYRPRPGTSQDIADDKSEVHASYLDEMNFKREVKFGLEQFAHLGTCIFKWGIAKKEVCRKTRESQKVNLQGGIAGQNEFIYDDGDPKIKEEYPVINMPTFEWIDLREVLIPPTLDMPDISFAEWAIHKKAVDFYQLEDLLKDPDYKVELEAGEALIDLWFPPSESAMGTQESPAMQQTIINGIVHHAEKKSNEIGGDPLRRKLELFEYWDKDRCIVVLNRKKVIKSVKNPFNRIPFLSANYWNRPKAFYGMGIGLIVGQNQRVDQGLINAVLKILSFNVNPIYLRNRAMSNVTQTIRTGLGKILPVDGDPKGAFSLLEMPRLDPNVWAAAQESNSATVSSTGADERLVQGSSAGPGSSMGRTANGAGILASANADRLEGPLSNFIDQVFVPFLYILDELIYEFVPDAELIAVLGQTRGKELLNDYDLDKYHKGKCQYGVLAGAALAAKRTMAQSLVMMFEWLINPQIQQFMADVHQEYIEVRELVKMLIVSSDWRNTDSLIKPMTPEMIAQRKQASSSGKFAQDSALQQQKDAAKAALHSQDSQDRLKNELTRKAMDSVGQNFAVLGDPGNNLFGTEGGVEQ